jgi:hypothetical protein
MILLAAPRVSPGPEPDRIFLLEGTLRPEPGLAREAREALAGRARVATARGRDRIHALVQLHAIPDPERMQELRAAGVELQQYVPELTWVAAVPADRPERLAELPLVRWIGDWGAPRKLHPRIKAGQWSPWALHPTQRAVMVLLQLHADVPLAEAPRLAAAHGGVALPPIEGLHGTTVWIAPEKLGSLASEEDVLWIEEGPPPLSPINDGVLDSMLVEEVQAPPYSLDGSGVRLFVFDGGRVRATHSNFNATAGRVTTFDATAVSDHSTHVAGTAAGDGGTGANARARGVAPAARILSSGY